ncbi:Cell-death-related_nuclease 7 [Hexamita inflata]|uniref:Cell-death-related_nuclease 7 n=1 Tax=Hexamita inflata TaxID=28002 RepID=A0ABP1HI85_9EUKA
MNFIVTLTSLSCKNAQNNDVDWFIQIKQNNGYDTVYVDESTNYKFTSVPSLGFANTNPAILSLKPVYADQSMYLMLFNDDTSSDVTTFTLAHQKGIIAFDKNSNTGFYMMHSTPGWPNLQNETLGYTSGSYGQHFLCINIDQTQLEVLGKDLYVTRPQIYWNSFDSAFLTSIAPTMKLVQDLKYNLTSNKILSQLVSRSGKVFQLYYKNSQSKSHLWPDLAQQFQENFQVETWLRDSDMRSFCGSYTVQMAGRVQYLNYSWKETTDHSKWGVSKSYACFSDINFQTSQQSRGGSALCFKDTKMAALFQSAIVELDQSLICCDSNSYTYITPVAPYNQDYQCAQCDLPSIQQLNLTIHPTMKQCLQCQNFVSRLTLTCVDQCDSYNNTICETLSDSINCPVYNVAGNLKTCAKSCGQNQIPVSGLCTTSQCSKFTLRTTGACVESCEYYNGSICETISDSVNCPVYNLINNRKQCAKSCLQTQIIQNQQCVTCNQYINRASNTCVASCDYYNSSVCESITDKINCPLYIFISNKNTCVLSCQNKLVLNNQCVCPFTSRLTNACQLNCTYYNSSFNICEEFSDVLNCKYRQDNQCVNECVQSNRICTTKNSSALVGGVVGGVLAAVIIILTVFGVKKIRSRNAKSNYKKVKKLGKVQEKGKLSQIKSGLYTSEFI